MKKDIQNKKIEELQKDLADARAALRTFRLNLVGSKVKNIKEGMMQRKNIARIMTEINARA